MYFTPAQWAKSAKLWFHDILCDASLVCRSYCVHIWTWGFILEEASLVIKRTKLQEQLEYVWARTAKSIVFISQQSMQSILHQHYPKGTTWQLR